MTVVLRIGKQGPPGPQGPAGAPGTSGILTTKGDLLTRDVATEVRLPVGVDGQVLESDSVAAEGVAWKTRPATTPLTTKGDVLSHDGAAQVRVPVGTDGQVLTANSAVADGVDFQTPVTLAHGLGSASHTTTTVAGLNALLSDGPVDVATAPRTPLAHAIGGAEHTTSSLAAFNAKITGGNLDFDTAERTAVIHGLGDPTRHSSTDIAGLSALLTDGPVDAAGTARPPTAHLLSAHGAVTLAAFNALISSGDLDLVGTPRPPLAHAFGGASHTADSLANVNTKLIGGDLDFDTASRPPSGAAGGDLGGSFPAPTVNDGADSTAIHVDIVSEVAGLTLKAVPAAGDHFMLEQLTDGAKRRTPFSAFASAGPPAVHAIGGAEHSASSLAALNALVTGGSLDFDTAARPPTAHLLGTAHTADSLANLNAKIIGGSVDFDTAARTPLAHALGGAEHTASSLAALNALITGGDVDFDTAARPPTTHALGGVEHSAATLAELNAKITGGDVDFDTAPRPPTAHVHAHADLTGLTANDHHTRAHSITSVGDHSFPGGTTFLRADGTFAVPAAGGGVTALLYAFSTIITAANPGAGTLRFNAVTYAGTTAIYINDVAQQPLFDIGVGLSELQVGDLISFAEFDDPASAAVYTITSTVDNTGWWTLNVTHQQDGGGDLIADGAQVWLNTFLRIARPHDLDEHGSSSLAELNAILTGGQVDDDGDPRPPLAHVHTHASTTGQTADDHHSQVHAMGGADHSADTFANFNTKISDGEVAKFAGALGGTAAVPDVRELRTTAGPTLLTMGSVADGELLVRSGTTIIGTAAGGGVGGALSGTWRYSTTTTSGDPGNGRVRTNSTVLASVTEMYIDVLADSPAFDFGNIFDSLVPGDVVIIQENGDATSAGEYTIDSVTDETGWYTFELTHIKNAGGDDITNNAPTTVAFVKLAALIGTEEWTYSDDLTVPVTADWAISVVSPLSEDSLNSAIHALMFDDTTEEGGALMRTVPAGASRMIFKTLAKPDSAPPGAETAVFHLRFREIQDNAAVGAWGTPVDLTDIDFGANAFHQKDETDNDLATWGLVVGKTYQLLVSRDVADIDDDLDDDCGIVGVGTAWTT